MLRHLFNRTLTMLGTLLVISALVYTIVQLPEGDILQNEVAARIAEGENLTQEQIQQLYADFGLDRPYAVRYVQWVWGLVQGDFGVALSDPQNRPVGQILGDKAFLTILLNIAVILFIWVVSFPIAMICAVRQYSVADHTLTFVGFLGLATPNFLLALILYYFAYIWFGIPPTGLVDPELESAEMSLEKAWSILTHLIVPVIVIGTSGTAAMIRRLRANLLDELEKPYVRTAKAKGLGPTRILIRYPLRLSLNPFIAEIGNILPQMVSGAAIISMVMALPTVGGLLVDALRAQDTDLAAGILMVLAMLTVVGIYLSDLALAALDPRIRLGMAEGGR